MPQGPRSGAPRHLLCVGVGIRGRGVPARESLEDLWRGRLTAGLTLRHRVAAAWRTASRARQYRDLLRCLGAEPSPTVPTATLLAAAEKDTGRPQATAPSAHGVAAPVRASDPVGFVDEDRRIAAALDALIALCEGDLAQALGLRGYAYVDTVPPHDRSPCGVVRLTTPTIPRAPGHSHSPSITTRWGASAARPVGEAQPA